jgi:hypothetical protein
VSNHWDELTASGLTRQQLEQIGREATIDTIDSCLLPDSFACSREQLTS